MQHKNAEQIKNGDVIYVFSVKNYKPADFSYCETHREFHPHQEFGPQCTQACFTNQKIFNQYPTYSEINTTTENTNQYFPISTPIYNTQFALHELNNGHPWSNEPCNAKVTKRNHTVENYDG